MKRRSWPWWRWGFTGLSALGLAFSSYLGWHYLTGGSVIGCGGGSPCDQVLNSRWSTVAGVLPVSGLAAGAYLAMLIASFFLGADTEGPVRRLAWRAMIVLAGAAAGSAVWFIIVQKWFVGYFCPYCMATHIIGLLLAIWVVFRAPMQLADDANSRRMIGRVHAMGIASIGVVLAGIMALCQVCIMPQAIYSGGKSQQNLSVVDPHTVPLVGSPDASCVVTLLFDYNCPHCQQLHLMLDEVIRQEGGRLAFALCPTPLNTNCNQYVPRNTEEFADSCDLAKTALAVWIGRREAFPLFDRWMFSFESGDHWRPRSLHAARAKAVELVGQDKFDSALADPWISRYLQSSIRIYGETVRNGNNAVPKLVFGSRWIIPQPNDAADLVSILRDSLAVPKL